MNKTHKTIKFTPDLLTGRLTEDDAKRYFSRFGWFTFALFLINTLIQNAVVMIAYYYFPAVYGHYLFPNLLSIIPLYCIALPIAYQILKPLPLIQPIDSKMGVGALFSGLCISVALMTLGNYISNMILIFFSNFTGGIPTNPVDSAVAGTPWWVDLVFLVILAPILEELLFRGIVCKRLLLLGEGYAIILPAAFFALCHGNFYQLFYAFALGCFFSFIYVKTGKLIYPIIYHMSVNFLGGFVAPWILENVDLDSLMNGEILVTGDNIFPLLGLMWYELLVLGATVFGCILMWKKRNAFKPQPGLLPPPEHKVASCVFLNAGVAAAIAIFALTLFGSLMI